ncbi:MAG: hypothetical protein HOH20_11130 [Rhodospirillaceae bacterium]|jgi:hypothetical protein|nr:hypothetical protein [Rhodospirillaceae bacterium]MBT5240021.1 hypothetical protein [Rhodospirillaceae bacterium]MBT5564317.1 hypothetical protein [Rhodospirillaceae bacterium]MBT6090120.1 hypothetical protein [Rhodospirillaceae bacterium]
MSKTRKQEPRGASQAVCSWIESLTMAVICICCVIGFFMCGGVLLASLDDPVPVIVLACLFCAGTMVSAGEVMKPPKRV